VNVESRLQKHRLIAPWLLSSPSTEHTFRTSSADSDFSRRGVDLRLTLFDGSATLLACAQRNDFRSPFTGGGDPEVWYARLASAYAEPHRHYHNQQHIVECLAGFDQARHLAKQSPAVEFALWFHYAVYDPRASDNEERSVELAACCLEDAGLPITVINSVRKLVMATKRHEAEPDSDEAVTVDVDLSILGQVQKRFA
jgi:hypothetical protein